MQIVCVCVCVCVRACARVKSLSHVWLFETLKTTALQAFSVHGILQARILEWVAMLSSRGSSAPRYQRDPAFLMSPALPGGSFTTSATWESESEVAQSSPTLCDPVECSPPGSSAHGILQARILEWGAISFSRGSSRPRDWTQVSRTGGRHFNLWATREALCKW